jgi:hypothetical protein
MRYDMRRMKQLMAALENTTDQDEIDDIQDEMSLLEEELNYNEAEEYKERHYNSKYDVFD